MSDRNTTERFADVHPDGGIEGYEPEFTTVDEIRTRYYDIGEGDPLVLVHGGNWSGISSANIWASSFEYLSRSFRVLAFDRLGCGMTDNPTSSDEYRYQPELNHALGFLDVMDVDRCHIVGSSRGGGLATRMAVEQPDRFQTLGITNSATFGPPAGDKAFRNNRLFDRGAALEPTDPEFTRYRYEQYAYRTEYITDEFCRANAYLQSQPARQETSSVMQAGGQQEEWEQSLQEHMAITHQRIRDGVLTMPTIYIYGREDLTVPFEMAISAFDLIAQENPSVRMQVFSHCGHIIYRELPAEFSEAVIDFVDYWG